MTNPPHHQVYRVRLEFQKKSKMPEKKKRQASRAPEYDVGKKDRRVEKKGRKKGKKKTFQ